MTKSSNTNKVKTDTKPSLHQSTKNQPSLELTIRQSQKPSKVKKLEDIEEVKTKKIKSADSTYFINAVDLSAEQESVSQQAKNPSQSDNKTGDTKPLLFTIITNITPFVCTIILGFLIVLASFENFYLRFLSWLTEFGLSPSLSQIAFTCIGCLAIYLANVCFYLTSVKVFTNLKAVYTWLHSILFSFFVLLYASGIDRLVLFNFNLNQNLIVVDTGIIFLPLLMLQFLVIKHLFNQEQKTEQQINSPYFWLLLAQAALVALQALSLINFLSVDRTQNRLFSWWLLDLVFSLPSQLWLFLAAIFITLLNLEAVFNRQNLVDKNQQTQQQDIKSRWQMFFIFLLLNFQTLFLVTILPFSHLSYWHRMLMFITMWDYYYRFIPPALGLIDYKLNPNQVPKNQFYIATAYHLFLIILILILPLF